MVTHFMPKKSKIPQNEPQLKIEQIQNEDAEKFAGLKFLEQERLKDVADLEAMLKMDEKEKESETAKDSDS